MGKYIAFIVVGIVVVWAAPGWAESYMDAIIPAPDGSPILQVLVPFMNELGEHRIAGKLVRYFGIGLILIGLRGVLSRVWHAFVR
ncbi:hypothetical protein [Pseudoclavibacter soli]|uniref:hypothetical protein n=1 Tax=Pseudoclavibacter soli TaxID=452623 RepID=UPI000489666F|nr:hypothetical protein [Pseudoclavibacter soli]